MSSHQVVLFEIELQDGVFDSSKHKADVFSVRGARKVGVNDLVAVGIQVHKHLQDELPRCLSVSLGTYDTHTYTYNVDITAHRFLPNNDHHTELRQCDLTYSNVQKSYAGDTPQDNRANFC